MKVNFISISRKVFAGLSSLYGLFAFIRDEFLSDSLAQDLKLGKLIGRNLNMDNISWIWFIFIGIILYVPEIVSLVKKFQSTNISVNLIPRDGKFYEEVWDGYFTWLEIDGVFDTNIFTAVLRRLESEKNGTVTNHLIGITKSSKPRLRIDEEKVFISKSNIDGGDAQIFLNKGESKILPENVDRFYFEVELLKDEKYIKDFKGYLVDGNPNWKIEPFK